MNIDWTLILSALGLALVIEGIPYFIFADRMPRVLRTLAEQPPRNLRILGLTAAILGLLVIWLARSLH
ncbi:DUF2065 domain-containing protein [Pseudodesulfovibrio senegalensis]|jgi:hypothetical protein|uniref:DUF2065 domain-containing protein n=1 Tax=Pseudodesulfovibrio senegalensis TaxID=1721087 RepID=A0A6N6N5G2_9BACT|nr:DUF2065 domain-containing protein [Pseudodesulfovibrio senegalensis]KAB1442719.1 DUF2065 domain-containing protein [Pseudodesulfovibrio senegalensis]